MIHRVIDYIVGNDARPTKEDIIDAIEVAKRQQCYVRLTWKGPSYKYWGDTYSRLLTPESNADTVFDGVCPRFMECKT